MLDFVPNHTGLDHPWVEKHPEYYVAGTELDLMRSPGNYRRIKGAGGDRILAYGRDPYFPGWPDTLQLDYGSAATREAIVAVGELTRTANVLDGLYRRRFENDPSQLAAWISARHTRSLPVRPADSTPESEGDSAGEREVPGDRAA